jgi:ABC-2 type transport system ATP-binding protein
LIRPTRGRAWVLGKPCGDIPVRGRIGYLPDTPAFGAHLTAWQFLSICARLLKLATADRSARIEEVLDIVKMSEHRHEVLHSYSRGMLQRIGIAQALLNRPELLILDEPLTGLDPEGRKELLEIACTRKASGVCVFFCSHILSDVEKLCDRVGILSRGQLRACGPLHKLLSTSGCLVRVPAGQDQVLKDLLTEADGSHRAPDGSWIVEFTDQVKAARLKERSFPAGVVCEDRQEGLEELFFRMTKDSPPEGLAVPAAVKTEL